MGTTTAEKPKELPILLKDPDKTYSVGVDVVKQGKNEIFTFCVMQEEKTNIFVQHGQVINKGFNHWKNYVNSLNEFYNTKAIIDPYQNN